jgi:hypothetical protein
LVTRLLPIALGRTVLARKIAERCASPSTTAEAPTEPRFVSTVLALEHSPLAPRTSQYKFY